MKRSRALPKGLRRRDPSLTALPRLLVVCEGTVTEPEYLKHFLAHFRVVPATVVVDGEGGTPKTLVARAVRLKKDAARQSKSQGEPPYDEVWCVFDVDEHPLIPEARQQARANGISLAVSNPCFELWFLLHFMAQRKHAHRHDVQRHCRKFMPGYEKQPCPARLMPLYEDAVDRAKALEAWQKSRTSTGANPSTSVHVLLEQLKALGRTEHLNAIRRSTRPR